MKQTDDEVHLYTSTVCRLSAQWTAVVKRFEEIRSDRWIVNLNRRLIVEKDRLAVELHNIEIEYQDNKINR